MRLHSARIRALLRECEFTSLFVEELGWSHCQLSPINAQVDGKEYTLTAVSEMGGLVALQCGSPSNDSVPDYHVRRKIDRLVSKLHYEHIIIYCDRNQQVWQWVKKEQAKPSASREHHFYYDQSGLPLIQKLDGLVFALEELDQEGNVSIKAVSDRVKSALDMDKVTKKFYDRFKVELEAFKKFDGITNTGLIDWYASLMLNRLMFIYFIQKKGFLDRDTNYLRNRLHMVQAQRGKSKFYSFYRSFLRVLFREGLNSKLRTPELIELIGTVPYLNGGLFEEHEIERESPDLDIKDEAFKRVFDFFDEYDWHLDTRPLHNQNEINPDVLGYIFEKYINQKQMGAYYTKEDITEYISKNTIIPYLFDAARKKCAIAFEGDPSSGSGLAWSPLREDPDRYVYEAVRKGATLQLPPEIAVGITDVSQRGEWNRAASQDYALPTEIWREVVARRQRYEEVKAKLAAGEVRSIDDLITLNLDIRQFAQDVIENTESPDLLRAFWEVLRKVTVLDPTCGSGAFLFAALNILEPLYEGCLGRMREFLEDWDIVSLSKGGKQAHPNYYKWFSETLRRVEEHPNTRYFIFKSIILNNLYGVDIMPEAVEICKLRLFLKLAAEVEPDRSKQNMGLEPLPDIDFNIRAGNTLVGFATYDEVKKALTSTLDFDDAMAAIEEKAAEIDGLFSLFREQQEMLDGVEVSVSDKRQLRDTLKPLEDELNAYLARQYVIDAKRDKAKYDKWLETHQPFHWFVEFHAIMRDGGFEVVIGNPPYVEYRLVSKDYGVPPDHYQSAEADNLYAFCMERSTVLVSKNGRFGMIVPTGAVGLDDAQTLRQIMLGRFPLTLCSTYAIRPSKLFDGVDQRLCIYLGGSVPVPDVSLWSTKYHHWYADERETLLYAMHYVRSSYQERLRRIPQIGCQTAVSILQKLEACKRKPLGSYLSTNKTGSILHYHRSPRYWIRGMDFEQYFRSPTRTRSIHHFRDLYFREAVDARVAGGILNSSLFFVWFISLGNGRNITGTDVLQFPIGELIAGDAEQLSVVFDRLMQDYKDKSIVRARQDCEFQEFYPSKSKEIIDGIDGVLAKHYGFTDEELDFIINYDIKYRMGLGGNAEEEG